MDTLRGLLCIALLTPALALSQTRWQTTHDGQSSGECHLGSSRITVMVHPFHLDVEEEAVIETMGSVGWGDAATLEIFGEFSLTPGSAVRSMLLWQGKDILKAKLKDRVAADSAYEQVVDRDRPRVVARDPALIECVGDNRYRFKIYPVAIGQSRRVRILYSVPVEAATDGAERQFRAGHSHGFRPDESEGIALTNTTA